MKLYTEEQLKELLSNMLLTTKQVVSIFEELTPIELPSDEEIENDAKKFVLSHNFSLLTNSNHLANRCFKLGAKWMKEQILNQNK